MRESQLIIREFHMVPEVGYTKYNPLALLASLEMWLRIGESGNNDSGTVFDGEWHQHEGPKDTISNTAPRGR